ncbi:MAG: hypothetical protein LRY57_04105 [Alphaproteobacteria bacterium]|nr:hypothetical protein [Alphaproteobacteria bacterium]
MSEEKRNALINQYLTRAEQEGRLEEAQEKVAKLTESFAVVSAQAEADKPLVHAFLMAYGAEPQAIRAVNVIAEREGGFTCQDASRVTHAAPGGVQ